MNRREFNKQATKECIRKNFLELYAHKGIDRLTTGDICESAGIARSTFYLYYPDKYSVLEELQKELLADLDNINLDFGSIQIADLVSGRITEQARQTVDYIYDHADILRVLLGPNGSTGYLRFHRRQMEEGYLKLYRAEKLPQKNERLSAASFCASIFGLFNYMLFEPVSVSKDELCIVMGNLLLSSLTLQKNLPSAAKAEKR